MRSLTRTQVREAMSELGVTPEALSQARANGPEALERLKGRARKRFREIAKETHPDLWPNDPERTARFMLLRHVLDDAIESLVWDEPQVSFPQAESVARGFGVNLRGVLREAFKAARVFEETGAQDYVTETVAGFRIRVRRSVRT